MGQHKQDALTSGAVIGLYDDAPDVIGDLRRLYDDEYSLATNEMIWMKVLAMAGATTATAAYFGARERDLMAKAAYAVLAAGVGINVGVFMKDPRVDSAAAAGLHVGMVYASSALKLQSKPHHLAIEAGAALAAGSAVYFYNTRVAKKGKGTGRKRRRAQVAKAT